MEPCPRCGLPFDSVHAAGQHAWKQQDEAHEDVESLDEGLLLVAGNGNSDGKLTDRVADDPPSPNGDGTVIEDGADTVIDGGTETVADGGNPALDAPDPDPVVTHRTNRSVRSAVETATSTRANTRTTTTAVRTVRTRSRGWCSMPESDVPTPGSTLGEGVADAATDAASDAADAAESSGGGMGIMEVLMHTEPDLSPQEVQHRLDVGPAVAHATTFVRKVIHAASGVGEKAGVPALVNAGAAGYHWFTNLDVDGDQEDDEDGDDFDVSEVV